MDKADFLDSFLTDIRKEAQEAAREEVSKIFEEKEEQLPRASRERKYISGKEVAERLGVTTMTLFRWRNAGVIPAYRKGGRVFYDMEEVEASMQSTLRRA